MRCPRDVYLLSAAGNLMHASNSKNQFFAGGCIVTMRTELQERRNGEQEREYVEITLRILKTILDPPPKEFCVRLWNGTLWPEGSRGATAIVLKHPGALRNMLSPPSEVGLGEAYLRDDFDIEGDVETVIRYAVRLQDSVWTWVKKGAVVRDVARLPEASSGDEVGRRMASLAGERHSIDRDREAVTYHYDLPTEFYRLFLDTQMVYSCAYFHSDAENLDAAQTHKLDLLCRKLRLVPGESMLDIGCGWGSLLIHAAREYGVDATGMTLSRPQAQWGNERIAQAGLSHRARIVVQDYRQVPCNMQYDALVSVGMFEHVGARMLPQYFAIAFSLLPPGGRFLNHGISLGPPGDKKRKGRSFSDAYVFPDGELVPISTTLSVSAKP